jgi:hypothetical protein
LLILSRLGPGLVLVHFSGLTESHPIFSRSRGGNVAGRISRELVREQAGQYVETAHFQSHRTYFFSVPDTEKAARLLREGVERCGLAGHAQIFSANSGLITISWPLPSSNQAPAKTILQGKQQGTKTHGNAARFDSLISALFPALMQRIKTRIARYFLGAQAATTHGAPTLLPANRRVAGIANQPALKSQKPDFQNEIQNKISVPVLHTGVASVGVHRF